MKAKSVNENQNFERGQDPRKTMEIGSKGFQVIFNDPDAEFIDHDGEDVSRSLYLEMFKTPVDYEKALAEYEEMKGLFNDVKLVQVWKD